jgi:hypothetical protein
MLVALFLRVLHPGFFSPQHLEIEREQVSRQAQAREAIFDSRMVMRMKHSLQRHPNPISFGKCVEETTQHDFQCDREYADTHKIGITFYCKYQPLDL